MMFTQPTKTRIWQIWKAGKQIWNVRKQIWNAGKQIYGFGLGVTRAEKCLYGFGWQPRPKTTLLASSQYASVLKPGQNIKNNRGQKPLLHWC